jgi:hypothetical protein
METTNIIIYQTEDGNTKIETRLEDETVCLTQSQLCELFQKSKATISEHIKHIFEEGELVEHSVVRNFRTTASDGKSYETNYYNLDVIISVDYRVKSHQGTKFRQWATARLREYIVKGFTMNDDLLKQASGGNYFEELLGRIRDIRSSEKVFWRKVLDIFRLCWCFHQQAIVRIVGENTNKGEKCKKVAEHNSATFLMIVFFLKIKIITKNLIYTILLE